MNKRIPVAAIDNVNGSYSYCRTEHHTPDTLSAKIIIPGTGEDTRVCPGSNRTRTNTAREKMDVTKFEFRGKSVGSGPQ